MPPHLLPALVMAAASLAVGTASSAQATTDGTTPAAIVARLRGTAVVEAAAATRPLRLFDRLASGDVVRTSAGTEVVVVFRGGARARIGQASRARVEERGAVALDGAVDRLSDVPTVPLVAPVTGAGSTITAVRIRAGTLEVSGPRHGTATLAHATVLEYEPVAGSRYEIAIQESGGPLVFRAEVSTPRFMVPDTVLRPGSPTNGGSRRDCRRALPRPARDTSGRSVPTPCGRAKTCGRHWPASLTRPASWPRSTDRWGCGGRPWRASATRAPPAPRTW